MRRKYDGELITFRKGKEIIIKFLGLNRKFKLILTKEVYSYHQQICLYLNQHQLPRNLPQCKLAQSMIIWWKKISYSQKILWSHKKTANLFSVLTLFSVIRFRLIWTAAIADLKRNRVFDVEIETNIRVSMVVTIHDDLLTQWRRKQMGQFRANIFLNFLGASEVFKNQSFKSQLS